jgi:uncharacterized protein involved in response to NO
LYHQVPFLRSTVRGSSLARVLQLALMLVPGGFLAMAMVGAHRVALLHLVLIGGFGLLTLVVATRVVFGHSGQRARLTGRLPWMTVAALFMLAGMATRISGDYWLKILPTHYTYGALLWGAGLLLWAVRVLPHVRRPDAE